MEGKPQHRPMGGRARASLPAIPNTLHTAAAGYGSPACRSIQATRDATLRWASPKATKGLAHSDKVFPKLYPLKTKFDPSSLPTLVSHLLIAGCLSRVAALPALNPRVQRILSNQQKSTASVGLHWAP